MPLSELSFAGGPCLVSMQGFRAGMGIPKAGAGIPKAGMGTSIGGLPIPRGGIDTPIAGIPIPKAGIPIPKAGIGIPRSGIPIPKSGIPIPKAGVAQSDFRSRSSYFPVPWICSQFQGRAPIQGVTSASPTGLCPALTTWSHSWALIPYFQLIPALQIPQSPAGIKLSLILC